jgi:phosphoribosylanthranilate isomerase
VIDGILQLRPRCKTLSVDISSGVEVPGQKGIKDPVRIQQFVAAVRRADQIINTISGQATAAGQNPVRNLSS